MRPDIEQMRAILAKHLLQCDDRGDEMVNSLYEPYRARKSLAKARERRTKAKR